MLINKPNIIHKIKCLGTEKKTKCSFVLTKDLGMITVFVRHCIIKKGTLTFKISGSKNLIQ